jgi:hypothetical protein
LIEARSFGSTSHIQIQQLSTSAAASGAGFLSSSPDLGLAAAAAATGGDFFNPGGGFFLVSPTLAFLARLRFGDDDDVGNVKVGGLLVDDGAEAADGVVLVLVLRFLDLVVGPATANVGAVFVPTDKTGSVLVATVN